MEFKERATGHEVWGPYGDRNMLHEAKELARELLHLFCKGDFKRIQERRQEYSCPPDAFSPTNTFWGPPHNFTDELALGRWMAKTVFRLFARADWENLERFYEQVQAYQIMHSAAGKILQQPLSTSLPSSPLSPPRSSSPSPPTSHSPSPPSEVKTKEKN